MIALYLEFGEVYYQQVRRYKIDIEDNHAEGKNGSKTIIDQ